MDTRPDLAKAPWRKSSFSGPNGGDCVECTVTGPAAWRKSSFSGSTGGDCVECTVTGTATWRTSTHSGNTGGDCVAVADGCPSATVPVRDSKNPDGPVVVFEAAAWQTFVNGLR
ncbi:DUF397 domain-containing protein [Streptomyces sp. NPDC005805]|uniref:DUF397 domain-containing protein n=1 Tax=Streptomyces sp. NPDC005805 TaxID=3157068 RepID=UPI0033E71B45